MTFLRYSLRSIAGVKVRFALTTLAVIIGVALTVGVLIATDGLRASLNSLSGRIYEKYDFTVRASSDGAAGSGDVLLHKRLADDLDIVVGDQLFLEFPGQQESTFNVVALHTEESVVGPIVVDFSDWDQFMAGNLDSLVTAITAPGFELEQARSKLQSNLSDFPQINVENQAEYRESRATQINSLLVIINVFLVIALLIAVVGISNTMALSVFERTRELGLVRAIGMANRQTSGSIFLESIIVSVFGGLIGIATGVVVGSIAAAALPDDVISGPSVPWWTLVVYLVVSAVSGMLAAFFPARRANRLNVLEAISHQ